MALKAVISDSQSDLFSSWDTTSIDFLPELWGAWGVGDEGLMSFSVFGIVHMLS